ncbi:hypothetical protein HDU76_010069 [Blyttiomyces sp. JEL0837]|nr:hypothetical protein HDU76_010069 [Blyttiomyces sp. JEL0837]
MLRRKPTRINLTLDDLKELQSEKFSHQRPLSLNNATSSSSNKSQTQKAQRQQSAVLAPYQRHVDVPRHNGNHRADSSTTSTAGLMGPSSSTITSTTSVAGHAPVTRMMATSSLTPQISSISTTISAPGNSLPLPSSSLPQGHAGSSGGAAAATTSMDVFNFNTHSGASDLNTGDAADGRPTQRLDYLFAAAAAASSSSSYGSIPTTTSGTVVSGTGNAATVSTTSSGSRMGIGGMAAGIGNSASGTGGPGFGLSGPGSGPTGAVFANYETPVESDDDEMDVGEMDMEEEAPRRYDEDDAGDVVDNEDEDGGEDYVPEDNGDNEDNDDAEEEEGDDEGDDVLDDDGDDAGQGGVIRQRRQAYSGSSYIPGGDVIARNKARKKDMSVQERLGLADVASPRLGGANLRG